MLRPTLVVLTALVAILAGDVLFRNSLLRVVHPVIVEPTDGASLTPPVELRWEGPRQMQVTLSYAGRESWDLGLHESPFELPPEHLKARGLYSVEIASPSVGEWISSRRAFFVEPTLPEPRQAPPRPELADQLTELQKSLSDLRSDQEDLRDENTDLYEENASIREENAILTEELNRVTESAQNSQAQADAADRRYAALVDEHQNLLQQAAQLRQRLSAVVLCSVWGYYAYPRPQTIPPTRRIVSVSDNRGNVFRTQAECEGRRRGDPTQDSVCFCVGSSFAG